MNKISSTDAPHHTLAERLAAGKQLRKQVPRSAHAQWKPAANRPDPVELLESSSQGRVPELIPIRYGRMLPTPFTFLRGSAGAMAFDLSTTPNTGIHVQLCGDAHLMNFGGFGTPERNFIFDVTDFDETLPGPWEWDVKRLAASVVSAARALGLAEHHAKEATLACVRNYRQHIQQFAAMHTLEVWYARVNGALLLELMRTTNAKSNGRALDPTLAPMTNPLLPKLTEVVGEQRRFRDTPPLIFHQPKGDNFEREVHHFLATYRETLQTDRRALLSRFRMVDTAMKVVGVGSVGTRCLILLLMAGNEDALILQYKEAGASVLEPFVGKCKYHNHGERVVVGQRMLQAASDLFLGWAKDEQGVHFYFRQLRDMKTTVRLEGLTPTEFMRYAELCAQALARGHAKAGDPALIAGYLGKSDLFDVSVTTFAKNYADQTEHDHDAMKKAVKSGRLTAQTELTR